MISLCIILASSTVMTRGTKEFTEECYVNTDCKRGLVCKYLDEDDDHGFCAHPGLEGDVCIFDEECKGSLFCSDAYVCTKGNRGENERCRTKYECANNLLCKRKNSKDDVHGLCIYTGFVGDHCLSREECMGTSYCDLRTNTCKKELKVGEVCHQHEGCGDDCHDLEGCDGKSECERHPEKVGLGVETVCVKEGGAENNENCTLTEECVSPLICRYKDILDDSGVCTNSGNEGDPCFSDDECKAYLECHWKQYTCMKAIKREGEQCDDAGCKPSLGCGPTNSGGSKCFKQGVKKTREVCAVTAECERYLVCKIKSARDKHGICLDTGDKGDSCFFDEECRGDLWCHRKSGTCDEDVDE